MFWMQSLCVGQSKVVQNLAVDVGNKEEYNVPS